MFVPKVGMSQAIELTEEQAQFHLWLSKKDTYDVFAAKVAAKLSDVSGTTIDPTHIRFTTMNANSYKPRAIVKRVPNQTINNILIQGQGYGNYGYSNQAPDALYYEVLELSLTELEQRKNVRLTYLTEGIQKEVCQRTRLPQ